MQERVNIKCIPSYNGGWFAVLILLPRLTMVSTHDDRIRNMQDMLGIQISQWLCDASMLKEYWLEDMKTRNWEELAGCGHTCEVFIIGYRIYIIIWNRRLVLGKIN